MKPEDILEFIQYYLPIAMKEVEQSRLNGHLQYCEDIFKKYRSEQEINNKLNRSSIHIRTGFTTSHYMDDIPYFKKWEHTSKSGSFYCLKKGMKASEALDDILHNSTTVIDCTLAIHVAWYLCIRALLIKFHGEHEGKARFNDFFDGDVIKFVISPYDVHGIIGQCKLETFFADNTPLSFFAESAKETNKSKTDMKACDDKDIRIGDVFSFMNHGLYHMKKPGEPDGAMTVACVGSDQYMGFGLGMKPLTELEINRYLLDAYNSLPLFAEGTWLYKVKLFYLSQHLECIGKYPDQIDLTDIPGYQPGSLRRLNIEKLMMLVQDPTLTKLQIKEFFIMSDQKKRTSLMMEYQNKIQFNLSTVVEETVLYYRAFIKTLNVDTEIYKDNVRDLYLSIKNLAYIKYSKIKDYKASILLYQEALAGFESLNLAEDAQRCRDAIKRSEEAQRELEASQKQDKPSRYVSPHRDKLQSITEVEWKRYTPGGVPCYLYQTNESSKCKKIAKLLNDNGIHATDMRLTQKATQVQKDKGEYVVQVNNFSLK